MNAPTKGGKSANAFRLEIPLDASGIEDFKPEQQLKVVLVQGETILDSGVVKLDANGRGVASLGVPEDAKEVKAIVGPESATDDELLGMQTLNVSISERQFSNAKEIKLQPIIIPPYYWFWWLRWCRTFTIHGRVLCQDGKPVPGANVCAYDIDAWWWWISKQVVGCATTDVNGAFEIKFRWCCGWYPWWWWNRRYWELEPSLADIIIPELQRVPFPHPIPIPDPAPDLNFFKQLIGEDEFNSLQLISNIEKTKSLLASGKQELAEVKKLPVDPSFLEISRDKILNLVPKIPALERLRIWPWWPWRPWWDCTPDIIFRVTQNCELPGTVIVDENISDTRWDIPTTLNVTLVANDKACCLGGGDRPDGTCVVMTNVCWDDINTIGGNLGAPATPAGFQSPNAISAYGDRPYGGNVLIQGQVGNNVDYYRFELSQDNGVTWNDLPASSVGDIPRMYFIPATTSFVGVPFLHMIDGKLVFESIEHYEATHNPLAWNATQFWMADNYLSLMNWLTESPFLNGSYHLRVKGYKLVGGHLVNEQILPVCNTNHAGNLVLQIDNRIIGTGSGHPPSTPDHPCGGIHYCTMEPDTNITSVKIIHNDGTESQVGACSTNAISNTDLLEIDFFAYDPEGHLGLFTLNATYAINLSINVLGLPGVTMIPLGGAPVPAALQVGPSYANARVAGAVAPIWAGGAIRLRVPAHLVFPESCCYQLELRAHKRTIVGCDHSLWNQTNYTEYSFMITV